MALFLISKQNASLFFTSFSIISIILFVFCFFVVVFLFFSMKQIAMVEVSCKMRGLKKMSVESNEKEEKNFFLSYFDKDVLRDEKLSFSVYFFISFFSFPYFFLIFIKEKSLVITTSFPSRSLFAHCRARGVALGSMKTVVVFSFK